MTSHRRARLALLPVTVLALASLAPAPGLADEHSGQQGSVWNLGTLIQGNRHPTTLAAQNRNCRGKKSFSISIEGEAQRFLKITGPTTIERVKRGEVKTTDALIDLTQMEPGVYNAGTVVVRCLDCPASCMQDYEVLQVHLTVRARDVAEPDSAAASGTGAATKPALASQVRGPCPEDVSPCDELLRRAQALDAEASAAQAEADWAKRNQDREDSEADWLDELSESDREYIETLRRQAREWRELAEDAEADARKNDGRAEKWPEGSKERADWERYAAEDRARARERRENADRLDAEADALEGRIRDRETEGDKRRRKADDLQAEADAKWEAAEAAHKAYEDCLKRLKDECEAARRREAAAAAAASSAPMGSTGGTGTSGTPSGSGAGTTPAGGLTPVNEARIAQYVRTHAPKRARVERVCNTVRYDVPRGSFAENIRVVRFRNIDDPTVLEVETLDRESRATGRGFTFHCVKPGTAILTFMVRGGNDVQRYRMRIFCE